MGFQMVTWPMTSCDPQRCCCEVVRSAILATAWLLILKATSYIPGPDRLMGWNFCAAIACLFASHSQIFWTTNVALVQCELWPLKCFGTPPKPRKFFGRNRFFAESYRSIFDRKRNLSKQFEQFFSAEIETETKFARSLCVTVFLLAYSHL